MDIIVKIDVSLSNTVCECGTDEEIATLTDAINKDVEAIKKALSSVELVSNGTIVVNGKCYEDIGMVSKDERKATFTYWFNHPEHIRLVEKIGERSKKTA